MSIKITKYVKYVTFLAVPTLLACKSLKKKVLAKEIENQQFLDKNLVVEDKIKFYDSKSECKKIVEAFRIINKVPGIVVGVSHKGKKLWILANGLADVETKTYCTEDTVMRIASISKPITVAFLAKLLEEGKVDLDKPIYEYLGDKFPVKYFNNQKVEITLRQLVSHLGGIRNYNKDINGIDYEFLLNKNFDSIYESLEIFKNDDLIGKPGLKFKYTSFGYVLISAVIDSILKKENKDFQTEFLKMLRNELHMYSTYVDQNEIIIPNRCKYYHLVKNNLENVPEINNVYKLAGGGLLSNVEDLLKFGNCMLYSYKGEGFLKPETVKLLWTPVEKTGDKLINGINFNYAMGWNVNSKNQSSNKSLIKDHFTQSVFHTGNALGVISMLIIFPEEELVIAILINSSSLTNLTKLTFDIAEQVYKSL